MRVPSVSLCNVSLTTSPGLNETLTEAGRTSDKPDPVPRTVPFHKPLQVPSSPQQHLGQVCLAGCVQLDSESPWNLSFCHHHSPGGSTQEGKGSRTGGLVMHFPSSFLESPQPSQPLQASKEHPCLLLMQLPSLTHRAGVGVKLSFASRFLSLCTRCVQKLLDTNGKPRTARLLQANAFNF